MHKFKSAIAIILMASVLSSCATVFGGQVTNYQRTKPKAGEVTRPIRPAALVADILLFWPGLIVDFATCAIYKPTPPDAPAAPSTAATTATSSTAKSK